MNILIAGRLGRYAERILALKHLGHNLVYCTMPAPHQKPLPDNLMDETIPQYIVKRGSARKVVLRLVDEYEIDIIYSMKNVWDGSLELLEEILDSNCGIPIVRHYKEHFCQPNDMERRSLLETDAQIYINDVALNYFRTTYSVRMDTAHILDTDYLPKKYMTDALQPKLYTQDGMPHLLMAGGASNNNRRNDVRELCQEVSRRGIQFHLYGRKFVGLNSSGVWGVNHEPSRLEYEQLETLGHLRLHDHIDPVAFVQEWSVYDAGLMHPARPGSDPAAFFNYPNRVAPYLSAGLPLAQQMGEHKAMEELVKREGIGFLYRDCDELVDILKDRQVIKRLTDRVLARRHAFTFEYHAPTLVGILARYALADGSH